MTKFLDAALDMTERIATEGDEDGRKGVAAIGLLLAHDLSQTSTTIESILRGMVERLEAENAELREDVAYWHDIAQLGVTPRLYHRLGLTPDRSGAA